MPQDFVNTVNFLLPEGRRRAKYVDKLRVFPLVGIAKHSRAQLAALRRSISGEGNEPAPARSAAPRIAVK